MMCLLILACMLMQVVVGTMEVPVGEVWTSPTATFWIGESDRELACSFQKTPVAVYWRKGETLATSRSLLTWYKGEVSGPAQADGALSISEEYSLQFHQLSETDTGRYFCRVSNFNGILNANYTDLQVLDPALNIVHTIPRKIGWKDESVSLPCDFKGDAAGVVWTKTIQGAAGEGVQTLARFDGESFEIVGGRQYLWRANYALIIQSIDVYDEANFTCDVELANGDELRNSTMLSVYAQPVKPFVTIHPPCSADVTESKPPSDSQDNPVCLVYTTPNEPSPELTCSVLGVRPIVTLYWTEVGQTPILANISTFNEWDDGTYDVISTLMVDVDDASFNGNDSKTYTCTAQGLPVDGLTTKSVRVAMLPSFKSGPSPAVIAVIVTVIAVALIVMVTALFWYQRKIDQRNRKEAREEAKKEQPFILLRAKRDLIKKYKPKGPMPMSEDNVVQNTINLGLFGVMAAGKSAFINSLFHAYNGQHESVSDEKPLLGHGGMTRFREAKNLTNHIAIFDNRGLPDYDQKKVKNLIAQIKGKRGIDPKDKVKVGDMIHCPIFVCNFSMIDTLPLAGAFIRIFSKEVHEYLGRPCMIVLTHRDALERSRVTNPVTDIESATAAEATFRRGSDADSVDVALENQKRLDNIKKRLSLEANVPMKNIWAFENYTEDDYEEDPKRSAEFLSFVLECTKMAEQNIQHLETVSKEMLKKK